jgi:hypothetical protein
MDPLKNVMDPEHCCQHITASGDEGSLPWSDFPPLTGGKFVKRRRFRRADFKPTKKKPEININIEKPDSTGPVKKFFHS